MDREMDDLRTELNGYLFLEFDHGPLPVATLEIWERDWLNASHLLATIASDSGDYHHARASQETGTFYYKVRYKNGGTEGPFSEEFAITVDV